MTFKFCTDWKFLGQPSHFDFSRTTHCNKPLTFLCHTLSEQNIWQNTENSKKSFSPSTTIYGLFKEISKANPPPPPIRCFYKCWDEIYHGHTTDNGVNKFHIQPHHITFPLMMTGFRSTRVHRSLTTHFWLNYYRLHNNWHMEITKTNWHVCRIWPNFCQKCNISLKWHFVLNILQGNSAFT